MAAGGVFAVPGDPLYSTVLMMDPVPAVMLDDGTVVPIEEDEEDGGKD